MDWTEAHLQGDLEAMQQVREEAIDAHALVRAALELAALEANAWFYDPEADMVTDTRLANAIRSLASDPAEVAAIIAKAGEDRG
jgi:hypothetical protein